MNILCYGDSNTWGYRPGSAERFPAEVRWTGVLQKQLGSAYNIREDGINGRRTVFDDPAFSCRNGLSGIGYALLAAKPLDLVVVMLGTNDLNHTDAQGYCKGITALARRIASADTFYPGSSPVFRDIPRLLLISPILVCSPPEAFPDNPDALREYEQSLLFAKYTQRAAEELSLPWMDAAAYAAPSLIDGCHMEEEGHLSLGKAVAQLLPSLF